MNLNVLVSRLQQGDRYALAKAITLIETEPDQMRQLSQQLRFKSKSYIIGITGPVGSGKSTLINSLVQELQKTNQSIGIILVDPSSTLTGGAFLGDRTRMSTFSPEIFIRSITTEGRAGGLSRSISDVISLYQAFGKDIIIVETAGSGKADIEIHHLVDIVVVVLMPGAGDAIQAFKAGIDEVADIFVMNKADLEGIDTTVRITESMLDMRTKQTGWRPPVLKLVATQDEGTAELLTEINTYRNYLEKSGLFQEKRRERARRRLFQLAEEQLKVHMNASAHQRNLLETLASQVLMDEIDIYEGADQLLVETMKRFKKTVNQSRTCKQ